MATTKKTTTKRNPTTKKATKRAPAKKLTTTAILAHVKKLDDETLMTLNRAIIAQLKRNRKAVVAGIKSGLSVGDKVTWTGRNGEVVKATVVKINRTKAVCIPAGKSGRWTVPMSLLKKAA